MRTKTDIANLCLSHLGTTYRTANIDTDTSETAEVFKLHYPTVLRMALRAIPWTFLREPGRLEETNGEVTAWRFRFYAPSDAGFVRYLFPYTDGEPFVRPDLDAYYENRIGFFQRESNNRIEIFSNRDNLGCVYTRVVGDKELVPEHFAKYVAAKAAEDVGPQIVTAKWPTVVQSVVTKIARAEMEALVVEAQNTPQKVRQPSPFLQARLDDGISGYSVLD